MSEFVTKSVKRYNVSIGYLENGKPVIIKKEEMDNLPGFKEMKEMSEKEGKTLLILDATEVLRKYRVKLKDFMGIAELVPEKKERPLQ